MGDAIQVGSFASVSVGSAVLPVVSDQHLLDQESFRRSLRLEQRRTERSRRPFVLLLMEAAARHDARTWQRVHTAVSSTVRETDISGWYEQDSVFGVLFTEVVGEAEVVRTALLAKLTAAMAARLTPEQARQITFSFYAYPQDWDKPGQGGVSPALYPETRRRKSLNLMAKRALDVVGSLLALVVFSPVFAVIAALVKLTSEGPVLFKQVRVGQYGQPFTFLKFRSMYVNNDQRLHQDYVKSLIAGEVPAEAQAGDPAAYKLKNDPRITPLGAWLRKTSLDELPQFLNVLQGEMALVGPRPPIPYEVKEYDIWHRRRLLEVKPGLTGLWQVKGRSQTTFNEMVRLDLQYARTWSLWTDIKLLLMTPWAMVKGAR